jgi:outer membrane protein assembly factor BamB
MPSFSRRVALTGIGSGLVVVCAGCLSTTCQTRQPETGDWTQIGNDPQHTGADTSITGVTEGDNHWERTHDPVFDPAGFAVLDDRIIIGGRHQTENGFLRLRSLADGELLETVELSTPVTARPVLSKDSIIATCRTDDRQGSYRVYDHRGEEQWTYELDGSLPAPPTISQSTVYGGGPTGTVFALREADGEILWERSFGDEQEGGSVSAPVTVDETSVYVPVSSSAERGIYALSQENGSTRWKIEGPRIQSVMVRMGDLLLVSYPSYDLAAFDVDSGERRWSQSLDERRISPPAVGHGTVVISDEATLYGCDIATGERQWSLGCNPDPNSQPVIAGDVVVVQCESGLVGCSVSGGERLWSLDHGSNAPVVPVQNGFVYHPETIKFSAFTSCQN